jgi:hypothetical protein
MTMPTTASTPHTMSQGLTMFTRRRGTMMTDWRGNDDKVRAVLTAPHEPPPELTYERLVELNLQGYQQADPEALEGARQQQRDQVRQARGDTVRA